jgi:exosortase/archaeosortase
MLFAIKKRLKIFYVSVASIFMLNVFKVVILSVNLINFGKESNIFLENIFSSNGDQKHNFIGTSSIAIKNIIFVYNIRMLMRKSWI